MKNIFNLTLFFLFFSHFNLVSQELEEKLIDPPQAKVFTKKPGLWNLQIMKKRAEPYNPWCTHSFLPEHFIKRLSFYSAYYKNYHRFIKVSLRNSLSQESYAIIYYPSKGTLTIAEVYKGESSFPPFINQFRLLISLINKYLNGKPMLIKKIIYSNIYNKESLEALMESLPLNHKYTSHHIDDKLVLASPLGRNLQDLLAYIALYLGKDFDEYFDFDTFVTKYKKWGPRYKLQDGYHLEFHLEKFLLIQQKNSCTESINNEPKTIVSD